MAFQPVPQRTADQLEAIGVTVTDDDEMAADGTDAELVTLTNGEDTWQGWIEAEGGLAPLELHPRSE